MKSLSLILLLATAACNDAPSTAAQNTQREVAMDKVATDQAAADVITDAERENAMR